MDILAVASQTGLQSLSDTRVTPHELYGNSFSSVLFMFEYMATVGVFLAICKTPGRLPGLKNVTRASVDTGVSGKWVKFQFWAIYPFNIRH